MRYIAATVIAAVVLLAAGPRVAAQQNSSTKIRPADSANGVGNVLGDKPESVLQIVKTKGVIKNVDLEKRTITVQTDDDKQAIELAFSQPEGREQIKLSKKVEKQIGKKKMELEELKIGAKVKLQYYGALGQVMELMIEETAG